MRVAIKLGGSIITQKSQFKTPNQSAINALLDVIAKLYVSGHEIVLIHGAGSYAHIPAKEYGLSKGYSSDEGRVHYSEVHALCEELSLLIVNGLVERNIPAVSFHPATYVVQKAGKPIDIEDRLIFEHLRKGFLPVSHGDVVLDQEWNSSIISGDELMKHFGRKWADKLVFVSDVDGLLDKFPGGYLVPEVSPENFDEVLKSVGGSAHVDVTGGMAGKIRDLMNLPVETYLVNGNHPQRLSNAVLGENDVYTVFKPKG